MAATEALLFVFCLSLTTKTAKGSANSISATKERGRMFLRINLRLDFIFATIYNKRSVLKKHCQCKINYKKLELTKLSYSI